ncbi:MAG: hypothetical protein K6E33_03450 [Lachnospiraceae bacterium]|nr:hypothetical protein [Lachnospiraceae bacterium]
MEIVHNRNVRLIQLVIVFVISLAGAVLSEYDSVIMMVKSTLMYTCIFGGTLAAFSKSGLLREAFQNSFHFEGFDLILLVHPTLFVVEIFKLLFLAAVIMVRVIVNIVAYPVSTIHLCVASHF